jgi:Sec-independent protein translocase protein TatA
MTWALIVMVAVILIAPRKAQDAAWARLAELVRK